MKLFLCLTKLQFLMFWVHATPIDHFKKSRRISSPQNNNDINYSINMDNIVDTLNPSGEFDPGKDIRFLLYTTKNPTQYQEIRMGDFDSLQSSNFNPGNSVILTIHGWTSGHMAPSNVMIRDAYLSVSDVNMITVDWEKGSSQIYFQSVRNVLASGPKVAQFLDWINEVSHVPFNNMHIIGHSLGGQMAGIVGRHCTRGLVGRITGLDPANPLWDTNSERIRKTDAQYVEIIHTNAGILGMPDAAGHNDFYPNGGVNMPGCSRGDIKCSHSKCVEYLAESIVSGGFIGAHCDNVKDAMAERCSGCVLNMGGSDIKPEMGIFAVKTN